MSSGRPYRITVREVLRKTVVAEDHVGTQLELPPVLPPHRTTELLGKALEKRGFEDQGSGIMKRDGGGVKVEVNTVTAEVKASASGSSDIDISEEGNLPGCHPCAQRAKESLHDGLRKKLERRAEHEECDLQTEVTNKLEKAVVELGCEMERVVNEVTAEALKEQAREMGTITRVTRDERGGITIVVQLPH